MAGKAKTGSTLYNKSSIEEIIETAKLNNKKVYFDNKGKLYMVGDDLLPNNTYEINGYKHYTDDKGKVYRIGDDLLSDNTYEINGYKYKTDDKGRIISAEGTLRLKKHKGRRRIDVSLGDIGKGDEKQGDHRGHLIGDQFGGPRSIENLIPQDASINTKAYRNFENELAREVKSGKKVYIKVVPVYNEDTRRPTRIVVTYIIDGVEDTRMFPN